MNKIDIETMTISMGILSFVLAGAANIVGIVVLLYNWGALEHRFGTSLWYAFEVWILMLIIAIVIAITAKAINIMWIER